MVRRLPLECFAHGVGIEHPDVCPSLPEVVRLVERTRAGSGRAAAVMKARLRAAPQTQCRAAHRRLTKYAGRRRAIQRHDAHRIGQMIHHLHFIGIALGHATGSNPTDRAGQAQHVTFDRVNFQAIPARWPHKSL